MGNRCAPALRLRIEPMSQRIGELPQLRFKAIDAPLELRDAIVRVGARF
jgi:hypothetical protein